MRICIVQVTVVLRVALNELEIPSEFDHEITKENTM